jgi:dienelactone hydrolase
MRGPHTRLGHVLLSIWLAAGSSHAASSKPPPDVELIIPTKTMTDVQFLRGRAEEGADATISAELRLPNWNEGLPLVILVHGSDGPTSGAVSAWRHILDRQGVATLRLDNFTGRGIKEVETDQERLGLFNAIYDVYRAVDLIAADSRIDPNRIVVMGFSRGGIVALYGSLKRFHDAYGPRRGHIAAYLPFYASCNLGLIGETDMVAAPVRAFHGAADDWVPAAPCEDLIDRAKASGHDATMTVFPGVRHAFDNPNAKPGFVVAGAKTARRCGRKEVGGVIVNTETGKPFSFADACVEIGPTVGYDKAATETAAKAVIELLGDLAR